MRHEKGARLLELARMLAGSAEGLTLDEMADRLGVGRRTAERMRDAVWEMFPQMEVVDDPPSRRFRIPSGLDGLFQAPTPEELVALSAAAELMDRQGLASRAAALRSLEQKVMSATRAAARRRLAPDLEALLQAETIAVTAGPRPFEEESVLAAVRGALKAMSTLRFRYEGGSTPGRTREVTPYGILFGRSNYLVAEEVGAGTGPRNWRLDRISAVEVTGAPGARRRTSRCKPTPTRASASTRTTPRTWCSASCRRDGTTACAGVSMPARRWRNRSTAASSSASGPAACASWLGTCSPGATRSRSSPRRPCRR